MVQYAEKMVKNLFKRKCDGIAFAYSNEDVLRITGCHETTTELASTLHMNGKQCYKKHLAS